LKLRLVALAIVATIPAASTAATVTLMLPAPLIVSPVWNVLFAAVPLITPFTFAPEALTVSILVVSEQ
jgi:hypothetical protein